MSEKQTVKFGDICREVKLTTKDPIADGYERYIGLEHLDSGSLKIKRWGMIAEDNPSFTRVFKKGHILFGKRRPYLKKAAIAEFDGICSGDIIVIEPSSNLEVPDLLPFIIQSEVMWDHAIRTSSGSLSPRTKFKSISELNIRLQSSDKQCSILKPLQKLEDIDERYEQLIAESMEVYCDVFNDCISREKNESYPLGSIGTFTGGGTPSKSNEEYWSNGSIPWVTPKDMGGLFIYSSIDLISNLALEDKKMKKLPSSTILFVTRSGVLRHTFPISFTTNEVTINQDLKALQINSEKIEPMYAYIYLWVNSEKIRKDCMKVGTTVESIDFNALKKFKIEVPCVDAQRQLIELFYEFLRVKTSLEEKINSLYKIRINLTNQVIG